MVSAGVHSFLRMSKQIAPVTELMLGCHIFVSNFIYKKKNESECTKPVKALTYFRWFKGVIRGDLDVH
jgi:hypothetical protein